MLARVTDQFGLGDPPRFQEDPENRSRGRVWGCVVQRCHLWFLRRALCSHGAVHRGNGRLKRPIQIIWIAGKCYVVNAANNTPNELRCVVLILKHGMFL